MLRLGNTSIGFCALKSLDWCLLGWGGPCRHSSHIRWFHNLAKALFFIAIGDMGKEGNKYIQINAAFTKININKQFTWEHPSASKLKYFPPINPVTKPRDVSRAARIFPRHTEISASLCSTLRQLQTVKNDGATLEVISHTALGKPGPWAGFANASAHMWISTTFQDGSPRDTSGSIPLFYKPNTRCQHPQEGQAKQFSRYLYFFFFP